MTEKCRIIQLLQQTAKNKFDEKESLSFDIFGTVAHLFPAGQS
jgi:hypothetical protein